MAAKTGRIPLASAPKRQAQVANNPARNAVGSTVTAVTKPLHDVKAKEAPGDNVDKENHGGQPAKTEKPADKPGKRWAVLF